MYHSLLPHSTSPSTPFSPCLALQKRATILLLQALIKNHLLITHWAVCAAFHPFVNTSQVKMVATCSHNLWILVCVTCQTHSLNQNICLQCLQLNSLNALQGKTDCRTTFAKRSWNNFSRCKVPDPDAFCTVTSIGQTCWLSCLTR
jgi:hypothetical protein